MPLHYHVKLKIRVFVKIPCWKSETQDILLSDFDFTYCKMQLFDFDITLWHI